MLFGLPALCDYSGTFDASNRLEIRGRSTDNTTPNPSLDVVDTPQARLAVADRRWRLSLDYSVMALFPDVEIAGPPEVVQTGDVGIEWRDRRVRLALGEYGQLGEENSAYILASPSLSSGGGAPPPQGVQALSNPVLLNFGTSITRLSDDVLLGRFWRTTSSVEYDYQGGLDPASRTILPVVQGPKADAAVQYLPSRVDRFETKASGLETQTSSGPCSLIILNPPANRICAPDATSAQVTEGWQRLLSRRTTVSIAAGASLSRVRVDTTEPYEDLAYPVVLASFQETTKTPPVDVPAGPMVRRAGEHDVTSTGLVRADFALQPIVDLRTGVLDERAQGTLSAMWPIRSTVVSALVGATRTVASTFIAPITSVQADLEAEQRMSPLWSLGGGVRYAWQQEDPLGTFSGGMIFVQVTVRSPFVRF